ncbi:hypothetical protein D3C71_1555460 [compost metagenome]
MPRVGPVVGGDLFQIRLVLEPHFGHTRGEVLFGFLQFQQRAGVRFGKLPGNLGVRRVITQAQRFGDHRHGAAGQRAAEGSGQHGRHVGNHVFPVEAHDRSPAA